MRWRLAERVKKATMTLKKICHFYCISELQNLKQQVSRKTRTDEINSRSREAYNKEHSKFSRISAGCRILQASTHQGDLKAFNSNSAGKQCLLMGLTAIAKNQLMEPMMWKKSTIDDNMLEADNLYSLLVTLSAPSQIPANGLLMLNNLRPLMNNCKLFNLPFKLTFAEDPEIYGNLMDSYNCEGFGYNVEGGLKKLFADHDAGIIVTGTSYSYAVFKKKNKFYFNDSHSTGFKGEPGVPEGATCLIECDSILDLTFVVKRVAKGSVPYTLDYIDVTQMTPSSSSQL